MRRFINKPENEYSWIRYIKHRIELNKNFLGITTGPTGSGKSWSNLSMGELLNENFSIDQVVFSARELMELINSGKLKKGSVIIFEEVGVNASSAQWQSTFNKMLNFLFQTFRSMNFILLLNAPYALFADKRIRLLLHAKFKVQSIDRTTQKTIIKPLLMQYSEEMDKIYNKRLRLRLDSGKYYIVDEWAVPRPSKEIIIEYEKKKALFNKRLNKEIMSEFAELENKLAVNLTAQQETVLKLLQDKKNVHHIKDAMGITPRGVNDHMTALRKKGYKIQAIKEKVRPYTVLYYEISK